MPYLHTYLDEEKKSFERKKERKKEKEGDWGTYNINVKTGR